MSPARTLSLMLDPSLILRAQTLFPDSWQRDLLLSTDNSVLLCCSRQSGKSTTVAALALHTALFRVPALVLILSPTLRQSGEFFRKVKDAYNALGRPAGAVIENASTLELGNGSRIVCLPGKEGTVRSFSAVDLLILDEAARVADDLYRTVRPMLAVSNGRLIALSTPFGKRGFFYDEWDREPSAFKKIKITWHQCPRITEAFIAEERRSLGDAWVRQEYDCSFEALEGLVYPDFGACIVDIWPLPSGRPVGGIDFGWRNPFAALWGVVDRDDVLWIGNERYLRETPLHDHARALLDLAPRAMWYADPAGRTEIEELRAAGLAVRRGDNDIRLGVAALTARIRTGRLKVLSTHCPNLIAESKFYRYPTSTERTIVGENPIDDHNHALGALRYLVSKLDAKVLARLRKRKPVDGPAEVDAEEEKRKDEERSRETRASVYGVNPWQNEDLWETF